MFATSCIFCKVIEKVEPANIVYENETLIIFEDIHPAAKYHYLIVPKRHVKDVKQLVKDDIPLLKDMYDGARNALESNGGDMKQARFGFHWPPFNSVHHLHLHAITPTNEMSLISRFIFRLNSYWFVTPEYMLNRLST